MYWHKLVEFGLVCAIETCEACRSWDMASLCPLAQSDEFGPTCAITTREVCLNRDIGEVWYQYWHKLDDFGLIYAIATYEACLDWRMANFRV